MSLPTRLRGDHRAAQPIALIRRPRQRGQGLVEFALVFPVFVILLMGIIEFGLAFHAVLDLNYTTRDAALTAAEAGNQTGSDCLILRTIERSMGSPSSADLITSVQIYWADGNGNEKPSFENSWTRTGSTTCTMPDNSLVTVPYQIGSPIGYPESARCNHLAGCDAAHPGLDTVGVQVTYVHAWATPLSALVGFSGPGITFVRSNAMRMEPVL